MCLSQRLSLIKTRKQGPGVLLGGSSSIILKRDWGNEGLVKCWLRAGSLAEGAARHVGDICNMVGVRDVTAWGEQKVGTQSKLRLGPTSIPRALKCGFNSTQSLAGPWVLCSNCSQHVSTRCFCKVALCPPFHDTASANPRMVSLVREGLGRHE